MRIQQFLATIIVLVLASTPAIAGTLTGMVSDVHGNPLSGVHVEATYQSFGADDLFGYGASVKAVGVSGGDGRYHIDLGHLPPGEYAAFAYRYVVNGGRQMVVNLVPDQAANFAGNATIVRNFAEMLVESTPDLPHGDGGIFLLRNAVLDYTDLAGAEVTLVPLDGGAALTRPVRLTAEGLVVTGIAYGRYRAGVSLGGAPLQLRPFGADPGDAFSVNVIHDFTMGYLGNQFIVEARR